MDYLIGVFSGACVAVALIVFWDRAYELVQTVRDRLGLGDLE